VKITFKVPGKIRGKQRPRVTKFCTFTPQQTIQYENWVKLCYRNITKSKLIGYIKAHLHIQHAIPKSTSKKNREKMLCGALRPDKKPDIDNVAKIILDSLNGIAYDDDKQVVELTVKKTYGEEEYVNVTVEEINTFRIGE